MVTEMTNSTLTLILVLTCLLAVAVMFAVSMFVESDGRRVLLLGLNLVAFLIIVIPASLALDARP